MSLVPVQPTTYDRCDRLLNVIRQFIKATHNGINATNIRNKDYDSCHSSASFIAVISKKANTSAKIIEQQGI